LAAVAVTVSVIGILRMYLELPTAVLLYLVPIILAATRWGRGPAVAAAVASAVAHDFFFIPPVGTLNIASPDEAVGLVLLLFTALVTAQLAEAARHAAEREQEAAVARRSDDLKTALLRAVTHDLRTPLASIKANVSGLRQADVAYSDEDRAELLAAIDAFMAASALDTDKSSALACVALLHAKEKTGIERAQLSSAFVADRFTSSQRLAVAALIAAQSSYLHIFSTVAPRPAEQLLRRTLASPEAADVTRMERVVYGEEEHGFGIDPSSWFASITRKIDMLGDVAKATISLIRER